MAGARTTGIPVENEVDLQSVDVMEIPADVTVEVRAEETAPFPPDNLPSREIVRPSLAGNLLFLVFVGVLAVWGTFLVLYLLKSYLGIDIFPGFSVSHRLGL